MTADTKGHMKKPYEKPKLRVYGDIRTMTQAVASTTMMPDGVKVFGKQFKTV